MGTARRTRSTASMVSVRLVTLDISGYVDFGEVGGIQGCSGLGEGGGFGERVIPSVNFHTEVTQAQNND